MLVEQSYCTAQKSHDAFASFITLGGIKQLFYIAEKKVSHTILKSHEVKQRMTSLILGEFTFKLRFYVFSA